MSRLRSHLPVLMSEACLALSQLWGVGRGRGGNWGHRFGASHKVAGAAGACATHGRNGRPRLAQRPRALTCDSRLLGVRLTCLWSPLQDSSKSDRQEQGAEFRRFLRGRFIFKDVAIFLTIPVLWRGPPRRFVEIVPCPQISPTWQACTRQVANPCGSQIWVILLEYGIYYVMPKASSSNT